MLKALALLAGLFLVPSFQKCPTIESGEYSTSSSTTPAISPTCGCDGLPSENGRPCTPESSNAGPSSMAKCGTCAYPSICANPQINTDGPADSESPFYQHIRSKVEYTPDLDNACYTSFPLTASTTLSVRSDVFKNGTFVIYKSFYAFTGSTGVYRGEGLTNSSGYSTNFVFNDYVFGGLEGHCKGIYAVYRCYIHGDCVDKLRGTDMRTGYSIYSMPKISETCYQQLVTLMNGQNLKNDELVRLPNRLPRKCVTHIGGLECVNAASVQPGNGISLT